MNIDPFWVGVTVGALGMLLFIIISIVLISIVAFSNNKKENDSATDQSKQSQE